MTKTALAVFALAVFAGIIQATGESAVPALRTARDAARVLVSEMANPLTLDELTESLDEKEGAALREWATSHAESFGDIGAGPLADAPQPWGSIAYRPSAPGHLARAYLHVFDWHAGGELIVYGLIGGVKNGFILSDANRTALAMEQRERALVLTVGKEAPSPIDSVVVLEFETEPKLTSVAINPGSDGTITLHAKDSIVHGNTLRYEPQPNKNTVGYWIDVADHVRWELNITEPGEYAVEILQGCGAGSGGAEVAFSVGEQTLNVTVQDTGGFQNFVPREIGVLRFDNPGRYTLTVKPRTKPGVAVMDLRSVTLKRK